MTIPSGPGFVEEHLRRLQANGIQPLFMLGDGADAPLGLKVSNVAANSTGRCNTLITA